LVAAFGSSPTQILLLAHEPIRAVVQASAVAEEARQDVEVDLVDQAGLEERRADRGREDLEVLAVGSVEADPDRLDGVAVLLVELRRIRSVMKP
jgi:hypothetical protein